MTQTADLSKLGAALPFTASLLTAPILALAAYLGGFWLLLPVIYAWVLLPILDAFAGLNEKNEDPNTQDEHLFWYRLITIIWLPVQFVTVYGALYYAVTNSSYSTAESIGLMAVAGVLTGSIGIVFAHELMHQRPKVERHMADGLMAMAMYGHFRSEHLLVHHRYVATPKDPVTARYNEGFHRFFPRVLIGCLKSALGAEAKMLARKKLPATHRSNPFWKYAGLQGVCLILAAIIGGWVGVGLFLVQSITAIWQLELVNYVEHYGLTRKHLGDGKYEHCQPHHSWNSGHTITNYFLINLQRHSDHHYKPDRRFPLLQTYSPDEAPQLPRGYPLMTTMALFPPLWKRVMNPKVRAWRQQFYPEITDWHAYNKATNPLPK